MTADPPVPEPDTKDWTWVLQRVCPECGFDARAVPAADVADELRAQVDLWQQILAEPAELVGTRPESTTWSALEYGCHVRDVIRIYEGRLDLMLSADDPLYPNWDQDATAIEAGYHEDDPAAVSEAIAADGDRLAAKFASLDAEQWARPGRRSDGAAFTIDTFSRYFLHDIVHHINDATTGYEKLTAQA